MSKEVMERIKKESVLVWADRLFYFFWTGFMCTAVVRFSNLTIPWIMYGLMPVMSLVCRAGVFVTAFIKENDYSIKRFANIGIFAIIGVLSYLGVGTINIIDAFLVAVVCKEIRFKPFYISMILGLAVPFLIIVVVGIFGFTDIIDDLGRLLSNNMQMGFRFGFIHEEAASVFLYPVFLLASFDAWRHGCKKRAAAIIIAFSLTFGLISIDGGGIIGGLFIGSILIIYSILDRIKEKEHLTSLCFYSAILSPVFAAISTFILCYSENAKKIISGIQLSIANRFIFGKQIIENVPLSLFGHYGIFLSGVENDNVTLYECDNLYLCLIFYFGIIPTLFFFFMYFRTIWLYYKKCNVFMLVVCSVTMLVCIMINTIIRMVPYSLFFILALCDSDKLTNCCHIVEDDI